jgi:hypothetical protein
LGVGTNAPSALVHVKGASGILIDNSDDTILAFAQNGITKIFMGWDSANLGMYWYTSGPIMNLSNAGNLGLGGVPLPTARLQIKGSGSTSATTSLLVQNSAGTTAFFVRDDNVIEFNNNTLFNVGSIRAGSTVTGFINSSGNAFTVMRTNNSTGNATFDYSVAIGTTSSPVASAGLEVVSTTQGFLPPRMTTAEKNAITTPATGLMVFDTDLARPCFFNGATWITL